jgi:anti-sigma factor RsiW
VSADRPVGEEDLQALIDGRLSPERWDTVENYLKANPDAASQVSAYREQREALRSLLAFKASEPIPARLRVANIVAERRRFASRRKAMVAVALAWLAVGGVIGWSANAWLAGTNLAAAQPDRTARDAIAAHKTFVVEVVHPVEVGANQEQHLVQWLSKRLGRPMQAPDLNSHGFRLMGGRLLPAGSGPAAQFMYENGQGTRLTLYVHAGENPATAFRFAQEGGVSAFYWIEDGSGYAITAELDREQLLGVAQAVYHQFENASAPRKESSP